MNIPFVILAGLIGWFAGSVINLLADDLPDTLRIRGPHYPDGAPRPWSGLLAFLLRRRKSPGGAKLSWRHPLTEIVTAALFAYIAFEAGFSGRAVYFMGNVVILTLITVIDLEHRMILFVVIIPACIYALIGAALVGPEISKLVPFQDYLVGGLAGFLIFMVMYGGGWLFNVVVGNARREEVEEVAFGYGDVMLATLSGFMLGWQALIFAVTIAVFAGGAGALLFMISRMLVKGKYEALTALPYGQYIVFGTIVMMLWRTPVLYFLQRVG
jgi:leader peptidase (prepilin peptidase) / N-methyltransferase